VAGLAAPGQMTGASDITGTKGDDPLGITPPQRAVTPRIRSLPADIMASCGSIAGTPPSTAMRYYLVSEFEVKVAYRAVYDVTLLSMSNETKE